MSGGVAQPPENKHRAQLPAIDRRVAASANRANSATPETKATLGRKAARATAATSATGVPDRPTPLDQPDRSDDLQRPDRPDLLDRSDRPDRSAPLVRKGTTKEGRQLVLHRIDPWSVFVFSFVFSVLLAVAIMVAAGLLVTLLSKLGVLRAVNDLVNEVQSTPVGTSQRRELLTTSRLLGGAAVLAAVDIVLLTALSTMLAVLYNACVALTGGIQVTVAEPAER